MSADDVPPQLKNMKRFLREAKKLEKVKPVAAYYCRMYAVQETMKLPREKRDDAVKQWLNGQMAKLEEMKVTATQEEGKTQITALADGIFAQADKVDREGNATKNTAAAFNTCFILYEVLKQFGERNEDITSRSKYCLFKTTDILKAFREGRRPAAGPSSGGENDEELEKELKKISGDDDGNEDNPNGSQQDLNKSKGSNQSKSIDSNDETIKKQPSNDNWGANDENNNMEIDNDNNTSLKQDKFTPSDQFSYGNTNFSGPSNPTAYPSYHSNGTPSNTNTNTNTNTNMDANNYGYNKPQPKSNPSHYGNNNNPKHKKIENRAAAITEAERMMRHAFAAMKFNDVNTALDKLQEALFILQPHTTT